MTGRVTRRVLREEIKEYLIDRIVRGELKAGDRIVETAIARQLNVSQGPVREALRDLEMFGLVVSSPFRGTQVREISYQDLVEIYPIRAAIEGLAARLAATRIDDAGIARLEELFAAMREAAARDDHHAHAEADIEFHETIVGLSGNRQLAQFWDRMRLASTTFMTALISHRPLPELAERHRPILDSLRAHDPAVAEAAMRLHIEELGEWILGEAEAERQVQTQVQTLEIAGEQAQKKGAGK